jgi:hypothetical protein
VHNGFEYDYQKCTASTVCQRAFTENGMPLLYVFREGFSNTYSLKLRYMRAQDRGLHRGLRGDLDARLAGDLQCYSGISSSYESSSTQSRSTLTILLSWDIGGTTFFPWETVPATNAHLRHGS